MSDKRTNTKSLYKSEYYDRYLPGVQDNVLELFVKILLIMSIESTYKIIEEKYADWNGFTGAYKYREYLSPYCYLSKRDIAYKLGYSESRVAQLMTEMTLRGYMAPSPAKRGKYWLTSRLPFEDFTDEILYKYLSISSNAEIYLQIVNNIQPYCPDTAEKLKKRFNDILNSMDNK